MWAVRCFPKPEELFHGPAVIACHAAQVMRGESIYTDWRSQPHVATVYGPLTYVLPGWVGRTLGVDVNGLYQIGRALSLLSAIGIGFVVYGLARRIGVERGFAVMAALAAVSSPVYWTVCCELRGEPPATLCSLLAVWWFLRFDGRPCRWEAALFIALSFLFKQSAILPLPAITLFLWLARRRGEAVLFGAATAAGIAGLIVGLNAATGNLYWLNAFGALHGNRAAFNLAIWPAAVLPICLAQYVLAAIGLANRRRRGGSWTLLDWYFLVSLILPVLMTWRDGAAEYYFMESVAVAGVLMAAQLQQWRRSSATARSNRPVITMAGWLPAAVAVAGLLQLQPNVARRVEEAWRVRSLAAVEQAEHRRRVAEFRDLPGPVLSQIDDLTMHDGREPVILDTWLFSGLIEQGVFDDSGIRAALEAGRYRSVVLRLPAELVQRYGGTTYFPRAWLRIIARRYQPAGRISGRFYVYQPNESTAGLPAKP